MKTPAKLKINSEIIKKQHFLEKQTAESRLMTSYVRSEVAEENITLVLLVQN